MLRIAVPNKGVLSEPAAEMLAESGYRQRRTTSELAVYDPENDTEFFYLRPRDIAIYVAAGTLDVGITGRDMLLETTPTDGGGAVAAEFESPERTAEEISQLLYRVQVLMLARGLTLDDVYAHL